MIINITSYKYWCVTNNLLEPQITLFIGLGSRRVHVVYS